MRMFVLSTVAIFGLTAAAVAGEALKTGDRVGAFTVCDITGPSAGKDLCYRCQFGNSPVVCVFAREMTENLGTLITKINKEAPANNVKSFVVFMTEDADTCAEELKAFAKKNNINNTPLTIFKGTAGPKNYNLCPDCQVTVMLWNNGTLKSSHVYGKDEMCENCVKTIVAEIPALVK